jgi:hypothetical protein
MANSTTATISAEAAAPPARPIRYETPDHVLCSATTPSAIPFLAGGDQGDGTFLYKLDLDGHNDDQDPDGLFNYAKRFIDPALWSKLAIRRSAGNKGHRPGYHIAFRTTQPLNPVNIYDPRSGAHAGELCNQRIELVGYIQGSADAIPVLSTIELHKLFYIFNAPGAITHHQAADDTTPVTTRKDRIHEGVQLIAGYADITPARARAELNQLEASRPRIADFRRRLRTASNRSNAYGAFVQSLMLHAGPYGGTTEERCKWVAALAIEEGANGKEKDKDYQIVRDTAALIAKILHGDPMNPRTDGTIPEWIIPKWFTSEPRPAPAAPPVAPPVAPHAPAHTQPAHRPPGDKAKKIRQLEKLIRRQMLDDSGADGRIYYHVPDLADDLQCKPRSVSNYLQALEQAGKIKRGQIPGRGGRAYFEILPAFWHANNSAKPDKAEPQPDTPWHANKNAAEGVQKPETNETTPQWIGAPKSCVASPAGAGDDRAATLGADDRQLDQHTGAHYSPALDWTNAGQLGEGTDRHTDDRQLVQHTGAHYSPALDWTNAGNNPVAEAPAARPQARPLFGAPLSAPAGASDDAIRCAIAEHFDHAVAQPRSRSARKGQASFIGRDQQVKATYRRRARYGAAPPPTPYRPPAMAEIAELPDFGPLVSVTITTVERAQP